jgi:hypothetical protein
MIYTIFRPDKHHQGFHQLLNYPELLLDIEPQQSQGDLFKRKGAKPDFASDFSNCKPVAEC